MSDQFFDPNNAQEYMDPDYPEKRKNDQFPNQEYRVYQEYPPPPSEEESGCSSGCVRCGAIFCGCYFLLMCIIPFACMGMIGILSSIFDNQEVQASGSQTLAVADRETINLEVDNTFGEITIQGDANLDEIQIDYTLYGRGWDRNMAEQNLEQIEVVTETDGDNYRIRVEQNNQTEVPFLEGGSADIIVRVPETLNLDVRNNFGSIKIRDVVIRDEMDIQNTFGLVDFDGALTSATGNYHIETTFGGVNVFVDRESQFQYRIETSFGETTVDLNNRSETTDSAEGNTELHGVYGAPDTEAELRINTTFGEVRLSD